MGKERDMNPKVPKIPKGWKLLKPGTQILIGDKFNAMGFSDWINSGGTANGEAPALKYRRYIRKIKP